MTTDLPGGESSKDRYDRLKQENADVDYGEPHEKRFRELKEKAKKEFKEEQKRREKERKREEALDTEYITY